MGALRCVSRIKYHMALMLPTKILKYFPSATIYTDRHEPGYWDSLSNYEKKQAVIILAGRFAADEFEMKQLIKFAEKGMMFLS